MNTCPHFNAQIWAWSGWVIPCNATSPASSRWHQTQQWLMHALATRHFIALVANGDIVMDTKDAQCCRKQQQLLMALHKPRHPTPTSGPSLIQMEQLRHLSETHDKLESTNRKLPEMPSIICADSHIFKTSVLAADQCPLDKKITRQVLTPRSD